MKKSHFNITHIVADPARNRAMHGLHGYKEVIETIQWGLQDIGRDVTVSENSLDSNKTNIVVGAQMLSDTDLRNLPRDTIVYNFEQIAGAIVNELKPEIRTVAECFQLWDYSEANVPTWNKLGTSRKVVHVPVGWAPILNRIEKRTPQDIDVLFYGLPSQLRLQVFHDLCRRGIKSLFACGIYGESRDELIARSRLVLNVNLYDRSRIFEIVRVSYLLANSKAVLADRQPGTFVEPDIENAVSFANPQQIPEACIALLDNDQARVELERRGRGIIETRHISPILLAALQESDL